MRTNFFPVQICDIQWVADSVVELTLLGVETEALPTYEPGAHIDIRLPNGLVRSYSLITPYHRDRPYTIAVNRDRESRGGSLYIHEKLSVGDVLDISAPLNNFPLVTGDSACVLIAGGIGITPLYCMAQHLTAYGRPWQLAYAARSRMSAAYVDELQELAHQASAMLMLHFDDERNGQVLNIERLVREAPPDADFYCCGPPPMLEGYLAVCSTSPAERVHYERFGIEPVPLSSDEFDVELALSGKTVRVKQNQTILDAILDLGIEVEYSCMQGICGSCITTVLGGDPDHRDGFLSPGEQTSNEKMLICCSRSLSPKLVLAL